MKQVLINLLLLCSLSALGGCEGDHPEEKKECTWSVVDRIAVNESTKSVLDSLFSERNALLMTFKDSAEVFIINNESDLQTISKDGIVFNFDDMCIIGGYYNTGSISDSIDKTDLSKCDILDEYKYEIRIKKCVACWPAINKLFFWGAYLKISDPEILINIKHAEQ